MEPIPIKSDLERKRENTAWIYGSSAALLSGPLMSPALKYVSGKTYQPIAERNIKEALRTSVSNPDSVAKRLSKALNLKNVKVRPVPWYSRNYSYSPIRNEVKAGHKSFKFSDWSVKWRVNPTILAHELGHAKHGRIFGIPGSVVRSPLLTVAAAPTLIASKPGSKAEKAALATMIAQPILTFAEEQRANLNAYRALKATGLYQPKQFRHMLSANLASYGGAGLRQIAATGALLGVKRLGEGIANRTMGLREASLAKPTS